MAGEAPGIDAAVTHEEEAAIWFTRLRREGVDAAERAAFQAWLAADPRHAEAWARAGGLWAALEGCEAELAAAPPPGVSPGARAGLRRRALWKPALGAAVAASAAGLWVAGDPALGADWRTGTGERRSLTLSDGTLVEMDAGTALSADLAGVSRQVRLLAGQAFFAVRPGGGRPFEVQAAGGLTSVTEAQFGVALRGDGAQVAALEGSVVVSQPDRLVTLGKGETASYGPAGIQGPLRGDAPGLLAWRQGQMILRAARLGDVARDLERYRGGRIIVTDRAAAEIAVSGAFSTRDPDAVLEAMARSLPLRIRRVAGYLVLISAA
jgi:transmembrane sensor